MTPLLAFALGAVIMWALNSRARNEARQWRILQALESGAWWYVLDLSPACRVGPCSIYATLFRLERLGRVERQTDQGGRARYRLLRPAGPSHPGGEQELRHHTRVSASGGLYFAVSDARGAVSVKLSCQTWGPKEAARPDLSGVVSEPLGDVLAHHAPPTQEEGMVCDWMPGGRCTLIAETYIAAAEIVPILLAGGDTAVFERLEALHAEEWPVEHPQSSAGIETKPVQV